MSQRREFWTTGWVGLGSLMLLACNQHDVSRTTRLAAKERGYLSDVPVAVGFKIKNAVSEDRANGRRRLYVRHVYEGHGDAYSLRSFYIEQMPRFQWQRVHHGNVEGVHTLRFEKGPESCTIAISPQGIWGDRLRIQVIVLQEERGKPPDVRKRRP